MFQVDWAQARIWQQETAVSPGSRSSQLDRADVRTTALLHWEEHCLECAIPTCYSSCSLYRSRADRACSRFVYGIYPNPNFAGLFNFGADIRFRRWGKLETRLYGKSVNVRQHRAMDRVNRFVVHPREGAAENSEDSQGRFGISAKIQFGKLRNKYFVKLGPAGENVVFDEFVLECFSPESEPFRITLEYFDREVKSRHSFEIQPGWNFYALPVEALRFGSLPPAGKLTLAPEDNAEKRVVFTWLDLVQYQVHRIAPSQTKQLAPASKIKCVAWDLDHTIWKGILSEDGEANLAVRPEALALIKGLDERGIVQTVVSKNNFNDAWPVIGRLGLQEYFLYPAINWRPKSSNLKGIAAKLNLNIDTFALIDDSAFERAEVQAALPQVRIYPEDQIANLLTTSEFDVPVSASSRQRRASYLTEIKREQEKETFGGDYEAFLRSCEMKLRLFIPREEPHILRCLELIQRANQLNLSNKRYTKDEFQSLLATPGNLCVAMDCEDRFGVYGIVGFARVDNTCDRPILRDLVLSCRVAQKRVEHTFIQWLASVEQARGHQVLAAAAVRTERNQPIVQVFDDLRFHAVGQDKGFDFMELPLDGTLLVGEIVKIQTAAELDWQTSKSLV
jgi:FkbH-like protein